MFLAPGRGKENQWPQTPPSGSPWGSKDHGRARVCVCVRGTKIMPEPVEENNGICFIFIYIIKSKRVFCREREERDI